jgi:hypothetical protein
MAGLTLDTGALIGFERFDRRSLLHQKSRSDARPRADRPYACRRRSVWRRRGGARSARIARLLDVCVIEPLFEDLARLAGEAIVSISGAGVIDAIVMASAA